MKRKIRRILEIALPVLGTGIIFASVLFEPRSLQLQVIFVLSGVLILEAGVWGLAGRLLRDERRYVGLREEVEHFVGLIPELNSAAVAKKEGTEDDKRYREVLERFHASVRRMGELAGQESTPGEEDTRDGEAEVSATGKPAREAGASDADTTTEPAGRGLDTAKQLL